MRRRDGDCWRDSDITLPRPERTAAADRGVSGTRGNRRNRSSVPLIPVPDAASVAAMRWLRDAAGIDAGPAAGAQLWGVCPRVARMLAGGRRGGVVTLIGDAADPYCHTFLDPE